MKIEMRVKKCLEKVKVVMLEICSVKSSTVITFMEIKPILARTPLFVQHVSEGAVSLLLQ